jgi:hypothetical protein
MLLNMHIGTKQRIVALICHLLFNFYFFRQKQVGKVELKCRRSDGPLQYVIENIGTFFFTDCVYAGLATIGPDVVPD